MPSPSSKKSLLVLISVIFFVLIVTYLISIFARGYQFNLKGKPSLKATGLLSATSSPRSASVFLDDRLLTATNDTINLPPGQYQVQIKKDGYLPWQKTIQIKKEIVYQTDAQLFRSLPDLKPITLAGAVSPTTSPDGTKIIYSVASASASPDNGLYLIDLSQGPLPLNRSTPRQIAKNFPLVNWSQFNFEFSPNSRQVLAKNQLTNFTYLLSLDQPISQNNLFDITPRLSLIKQEWQDQHQQIIDSLLALLPQPLVDLASTQSAQHISFNTSDDKILYLAKTDGNLPKNIITPPPAQSSQTQHRSTLTDHYYVYDIKDDTNFLIGKKDDIVHPLWLPNSNSLIFTNGTDIKVIEYDATNIATLFSGNFDKNIVQPWSDGGRIVTLTAPYTGAPENLYAITIR